MAAKLGRDRGSCMHASNTSGSTAWGLIPEWRLWLLLGGDPLWCEEVLSASGSTAWGLIPEWRLWLLLGGDPLWCEEVLSVSCGGWLLLAAIGDIMRLTGPATAVRAMLHGMLAFHASVLLGQHPLSRALPRL